MSLQALVGGKVGSKEASIDLVETYAIIKEHRRISLMASVNKMSRDRTKYWRSCGFIPWGDHGKKEPSRWRVDQKFRTESVLLLDSLKEVMSKALAARA